MSHDINDRRIPTEPWPRTDYQRKVNVIYQKLIALDVGQMVTYKELHELFNPRLEKQIGIYINEAKQKAYKKYGFDTVRGVGIVRISDERCSWNNVDEMGNELHYHKPEEPKQNAEYIQTINDQALQIERMQNIILTLRDNYKTLDKKNDSLRTANESFRQKFREAFHGIFTEMLDF